MTNFNSTLIALLTVCFGMASGIFFLLYCLEKPIYSLVLQKKAISSDYDTLMRRVLLVLQQFLGFKVPIVMVTLIISGTLGSAFRLAFYGFAPLPVIVALSSTFVIVYSGFLVPPAIKMFENVSLQASADEIQVALAPIVRLHRDVGFLVAVTLILHLTSTVF